MCAEEFDYCVNSCEEFTIEQDDTDRCITMCIHDETDCIESEDYW